MATPILLNPSRTAVLSMDLQAGIVSACAKDDPALVTRAAEILTRARARAAAVIHVKVGFRPGLPEVSANNPLFSALKNSAQHQKLFEGSAGEIHPALGPEPGDIVVVKHRVSAFIGTDLEMILRAQEIDTLVLFGISTSGVVLSTALHASDADYRLVVVKDCCTDLDAQTHTTILDGILARRATVISAAELLELLK